jgi:hypothetical protein
VEKLKEGKKVVALRFVFQRKSDEEIKMARGEFIGKSLEIPFPPPQKNPATEQPETEKDRLFNLFHADVVQKFGVTPSVFLDLLEGCNEQQVSQAIRVTRRAKSLNQIKSSIAGFFVQALKNGFTDPKEEELKQSAAKAKSETIKQRLEALKEEYSSKINEKIREITTANPELTNEAIQALYDNPISKSVIDEQEKAMNRALNIEDFRQERILREMVKAKFVDMRKPDFITILERYDAALAALKREYAA